MRCKVLVLTHSNLAETFIQTTQMIFGDVELLQYKNMPEQFDIEQYKTEIEVLLEENRKTGVLVITDLLGGSPFLSCSQLAQRHWDNMELITGCNLPMLLAVVEEIEKKSVSELKQIAIAAGRDGIVDLKEQIREVQVS